MNNDVCNIVSGFGQEGVFELSHPIDFSKAVKVERSGATCDAYITRYQRRRVFVKRLKPELQSSPRHRAAFDKEYDIGVNLKHPSLPEYREIHDDYIIVDFIDGVTLADMIKDNDEWLRSKKNIRKMLSQLVDVIGYLHHHHVVHCDIKADNIMLTHGSRDMMLVDLGNCYTDWLDDTSGTPSNFGLTEEKKGNPQLDYRGIGKIIDSLSTGTSKFPLKSFSRFRNLCFKTDVTIDELREGITPHKNSGKWLLPSICIASVSAIFFMMHLHQQTVREGDTAVYINANDSTPVISENAPIIGEDDIAEEPVKDFNAKTTEKPMPSKQEINNIIEASLKELFTPLSRLEQTVYDTTLSGKELLSVLADYSEIEESVLADSYKTVSDMVPESRRDSVYAIYYSCDAYSAYIKESNRIQKRVGEEARSRIKAEKEAGN